MALVAASLGEAREIMIEGPSGLRAIAPAAERPHFEATRRRLVWPNGSVAHTFSAADPDGLRGPQFHAAWCDELAAWPRPSKAFDTLSLGVRLGARPRLTATTTPRATAYLRDLVAAPDVVVSRSASEANAAWLAPGFLEAVRAAYAGTRFERQELDGVLLDDLQGALWSRELIARRLKPAPARLDRIVVAVDPPVSVGEGADACGVIVAGRARAAHEGVDHAFVLADRTSQGLGPHAWAQAVAETSRAFDAASVIVEINQGGALVRSVLQAVAPDIVVREARAVRAKFARAEPVAALYERGRVWHADRFRALEDEMCAFTTAGRGVDGASPDRVDALVWAVAELLLAPSAAPRLRTL